MPPWNLEETRALVLQRYGEAQIELLEPSLASLHDRQFYAGYHYHEFRRLLHESIDSKLGQQHILELTLPLTTESLVSITTLRKRVAANVLACLQSLHALADTLAHAIAYASGLNVGPKALSEADISLYSVESSLKNREGFRDVAAALGGIKCQPDFLYIATLVNHSKHRSIIEPRIVVDATGVQSNLYILRFCAFKYKGTAYDVRDVESLLEPFYSWLSFQIVDCGNQLNFSLRNTYL